jgi:ArsR family transcriptional regulator, arsenate/arsenite/antimonite-responsive transcriptional repressor
LDRGVNWHEVVSSECPTFLEHLPEIIERAERGCPVVLAPCAFFGRGLYFELPGCILVGVGVHSAVHDARARTEQVVRPLRALADPTRLAIFGYLKSGPAAVSDIAQAFYLAQPTVSVHVKRLREAGLVTAARHGNRLEISIDESVTELLAAELAALLSG